MNDISHHVWNGVPRPKEQVHRPVGAAEEPPDSPPWVSVTLSPLELQPVNIKAVRMATPKTNILRAADGR